MRARSLCLTIAAGCLSASALSAQAKWSLVENLRIGSEEDGPYLFSNQIRGVALEIRLFDRDGKFVKRVARGGAGPGEIGNANGLLTAPDGRLWVNDPSSSRYTVFTASGDYSASHLYSPWGQGYLWQAVFDRSGTLLEYISVPSGNVRIGKARRVTPDGAKVDTIALPECQYRGPEELRIGYVARSGRSTYGFGVPFQANPLRAWDAGGFIWCSSNDRYEILKISLVRGDTLLRVNSPRSPIRVPDQQRDAEIERLRSAFARLGQPPPDFSQVPRVKPALENIDVDDAGRVWVRPTQSDTTRTVFEVWDGTTGRQLATVAAPWRIAPSWRPLIRGDTMHTVILDENEVPLVVRAVIRK